MNTANMSHRRLGKVLVVLVCGIGLLFSLGAVFEANAVSTESFGGTVMHAGASTLIVVSRPDNDTLLFHVNSESSITKDGETVSLEDIANGDSVSVDSRVKENVRIAAKIVAHSPY